MQRIRKDEIVQRLETILGAEVGKEGLNTLIYGWLKMRRYGEKYREVIWHRKWLYITEVQDLSEYAGYDLSISEA